MPEMDFGHLLDEPKFADFAIEVDGERIPIHRNIYATYSDVFARMFERDMEEKAQGFVLINDFSPEIMRGLQEYLYTGRTAAVEAEVGTFLDLAEKYNIRPLKEFCVAELGARLSCSTLCATGVLADKYGLQGLFRQCRELIRKEFEVMPKSSRGKWKADWAEMNKWKADWAELEKEHKDVARRLSHPFLME